MQKAQYFVVCEEGQWKIKAGYRTTGAYADEAEALSAAIEFAEKDGMAGRDAQVLIQGDDHHFRPVWIYGRDPYPIDGAKTLRAAEALAHSPHSAGRGDGHH